MGGGVVFCVLGSWLVEFSGVADFVESYFVLFRACCSHGLNITSQTRRLAPISLVTVILYSESVVRINNTVSLLAWLAD